MIVWHGNEEEYEAVIADKERELARLKKQLTGEPMVDWYALNNIAELEIQIADLREWAGEQN